MNLKDDSSTLEILKMVKRVKLLKEKYHQASKRLSVAIQNSEEPV